MHDRDAKPVSRSESNRQAGSAQSGSVGGGAAGQLLQRAAGLYARGNLQGAESACRQLLQIRPDQADARHILGLVAWRRGDRQGAAAEIRQAIAIAPGKPQPHNSLGVLLKEEGGADGAEAAFRTAVGLQPDYPEALTNLGNILCETGRLAEAEARHRRVVELAPGYADGHNNLATALAKQERWEEAIEACRAAVRLEPSRAEFQLNLGNSLAAAKIWEEAAEAFRRAIDLAPGNAGAHADLGIVLCRLRRFGEAVEAHRSAVALNPACARYWIDLSAALVDADRPHDALDACGKALALDAGAAEAHISRGKALQALGQSAEAVEALKTAIALCPHYARAYNNLGMVFNGQGRFVEAMSCYEKAVELDSLFDEARLNKGLLHLLLGELESGWELYEYGLDLPGGGRSKFRFDTYPVWAGTPLAGKTIMVWSEQGIGDQVMFASLIPELMDQGARCVVEADRRLEPLFRRSFDGIEFISRKTATAAVLDRLAIDYQVFMGSLGRWFRPSLASFSRRPGFFRADQAQVSAMRDQYRRRLGDRLLVGISWMGGVGAAHRMRSIPLVAWSPILQQSDVGLIDLQYGDHASELATVRDALGVEILHDDEVDPLRDLDRFAAQTAAMDLVISIDNSTVHMAGALNVPVWIMLPAVPDWRWLLNRSDSLWHASARLFRQATPGEWSSVINRAADELRLFASDRPHRLDLSGADDSIRSGIPS
jgi:Flp pilus assembly protein TadD